MKRACLLLCSILAAAAAGAETRYVTDSFEVPVRSGRSLEHRIVELATSGMPLEVLETGADGYTRVRTPEGAEGWILSRYLMDAPAARTRLQSLQEKFATAQQGGTALEQDVSALTAELRKLQQQNLALQEQNRNLLGQLEGVRQTAARPLEISERNAVLEEELARDRDSLEVLLRENAKLRDHSHRDWFVVGAIVTAAGVLLGLLLARFPLGRRRGWGDM